MMNRERALRAREISRPSAENREKAAQTVPQLIERARGRRRG